MEDATVAPYYNPRDALLPRVEATHTEYCTDLPPPVVHPEPKQLERWLEGRLVRNPHGHVEVIEEDDKLLAAQGSELILRPLLHRLLNGCLR